VLLVNPLVLIKSVSVLESLTKKEKFSAIAIREYLSKSYTSVNEIYRILCKLNILYPIKEDIVLIPDHLPTEKPSKAVDNRFFDLGAHTTIERSYLFAFYPIESFWNLLMRMQNICTREISLWGRGILFTMEPKISVLIEFHKNKLGINDNNADEIRIEVAGNDDANLRTTFCNILYIVDDELKHTQFPEALIGTYAKLPGKRWVDLSELDLESSSYAAPDLYLHDYTGNRYNKNDFQLTEGNIIGDGGFSTVYVWLVFLLELMEVAVALTFCLFGIRI